MILIKAKKINWCNESLIQWIVINKRHSGIRREKNQRKTQEKHKKNTRKTKSDVSLGYSPRVMEHWKKNIGANVVFLFEMWKPKMFRPQEYSRGSLLPAKSIKDYSRWISVSLSLQHSIHLTESNGSQILINSNTIHIIIAKYSEVIIHTQFQELLMGNWGLIPGILMANSISIPGILTCNWWLVLT